MLACAKKNNKNDSHPEIKQTEMPPTPGEMRCLVTQDLISFCRQVQVSQVNQVLLLGVTRFDLVANRSSINWKWRYKWVWNKSQSDFRFWKPKELHYSART